MLAQVTVTLGLRDSIRLKIRHKTVFVYFTYSLNGCAWFLPF